MTIGLILLSLKILAGDLRPKHPRPDFYREKWLLLNAEWQFEIDKADDGQLRGLTFGKDLNKEIIVPFCTESKFSGLGLIIIIHMKSVWYRHKFKVPGNMKGNRISLHFGAVDYKA